MYQGISLQDGISPPRHLLQLAFLTLLQLSSHPSSHPIVTVAPSMKTGRVRGLHCGERVGNCLALYGRCVGKIHFPIHINLPRAS